MTYILAAAAIVGYFALLFWLTDRALNAEFEDYSAKPYIAAGVVVLVLGLAFVLYAIAQDDAECAARGGTKVRTGTTYINSSGGVMTPVDTYECIVPDGAR